MHSSYAQYREDLRRYVGKLLSSPEDVEEILQDTFLRITQHPPAADKLDKTRAYLFVIAANLVKDRLRRKVTRSEQHHSSIEDVDLVCNIQNPEDLAMSNQLERRLVKSLESLNSKFRHVYVLHRFMHLSHENIAKKLDISVRTVERRMKYAMDHLRLELKEHLR